MHCRCRDEYEWMMKMIKKDGSLNHIAEFINDGYFDLRYMRKRFGYLFFDNYNYIKKVNGRNAIFGNKEEEFVCRKPEDGKDITNPEDNTIIETIIPMEDRKRYDIKYLDEIDKGEPYITQEDKYREKKVKETKNIFKKIKLLRPDIFDSENEFYDVLVEDEFF